MDINTRDYQKIADKLKAIAHKDRLCIVKGLIDKSSNVSTIQECMKQPQSTISQHLAKLKSAGIIEGQRNGLEIQYSVVDENIRKIINIIFG